MTTKQSSAWWPNNKALAWWLIDNALDDQNEKDCNWSALNIYWSKHKINKSSWNSEVMLILLWQCTGTIGQIPLKFSSSHNWIWKHLGNSGPVWICNWKSKKNEHFVWMLTETDMSCFALMEITRMGLFHSGFKWSSRMLDSNNGVTKNRCFQSYRFLTRMWFRSPILWCILLLFTLLPSNTHFRIERIS